MIKRISVLLAFLVGLVVLSPSPANAAYYGGRCVPLVGCSTTAQSLNLSTAKSYFLRDTATAQYYLWSDGWYSGRTDGYFGPVTRQSVIEFQRHYLLRVDGIVGPETWDYLQLCPRGWRPVVRT